MKPLSLYEEAVIISDRIQERIIDKIFGDNPVRDIEQIKSAFGKWVGAVRLMSSERLAEMSLAGEAVKVEIKHGSRAFTIECTASGVAIFNEGITIHGAENLVKGRDTRRKSFCPTKLFLALEQGELFPQYDSAREHEIVCGENLRAVIGLAKRQHWESYDAGQDKSWKEQEAGREKDLRGRQARLAVFKEHKDCINVDAIAEKLGWKPKGSSLA